MLAACRLLSRFLCGWRVFSVRVPGLLRWQPALCRVQVLPPAETMSPPESWMTEDHGFEERPWWWGGNIECLVVNGAAAWRLWPLKARIWILNNVALLWIVSLYLILVQEVGELTQLRATALLFLPSLPALPCPKTPGVIEKRLLRQGLPLQRRAIFCWVKHRNSYVAYWLCFKKLWWGLMHWLIPGTLSSAPFPLSDCVNIYFLYVWLLFIWF